MSLRTNMTGSSNSKDGEPEQPEAAASASSTAPSEPVQLDLFERRTGIGGRDTQSRRLQARVPVATEAPPIFAHWAGVYRRRGYWPRPITSGHQSVSRAGMAEA